MSHLNCCSDVRFHTLEISSVRTIPNNRYFNSYFLIKKECALIFVALFFSAIETYRNNTPRSGSGSGRKRERKLSTASSTTSCNSSSNKRHKKSGKTSSVTSSAVSVTDRDNIPSQNSSEPKFEASKLVERAEPEMVKPEATHLLNLPGSSGSSGLGSARNLMPPPDKKVENDSVLPENSATGAAALLPQNNHYMADQDELQVDLRKIQLLSLRVSNNPNDYFWIRAGYN